MLVAHLTAANSLLPRPRAAIKSHILQARSYILDLLPKQLPPPLWLQQKRELSSTQQLFMSNAHGTWATATDAATEK